MTGPPLPAPEQPVHVAHRLALGVLDDVGVDVHGDADLRVPEDLHHDAGRDPGSREEGGCAVTSVVQPDHAEAGGLGDAGEGAVDVARLDRSPGARRDPCRCGPAAGPYRYVILTVSAGWRPCLRSP
jgi:hypothetical protein